MIPDAVYWKKPGAVFDMKFENGKWVFTKWKHADPQPSEADMLLWLGEYQAMLNEKRVRRDTVANDADNRPITLGDLKDLGLV